jgi:hypothetical protein
MEIAWLIAGLAGILAAGLGFVVLAIVTIGGIRKK